MTDFMGLLVVRQSTAQGVPQSGHGGAVADLSPQ